MFDTAIIGTGPAGLSAALTLRIHKKNVIWFGADPICEKVEKAEQINNYPGFPAASGAVLADALRTHAAEMELHVTAQTVMSILALGTHYALSAGTEFYEARTVLLATGAAPSEGLPGEQRLLGCGVSHCATCDGMLYQGKEIAVICTAKRLEHEVLYLAELAAHVDLFALYPDCEIGLPNVTVRREKPAEVLGDTRFTGLLLDDGSTLSAAGLFCLRTAFSVSTLMQGLETQDGHIVTNRLQQTNLAGCFAAGDCTGRPYQYAKAIGEGNVAAHGIIQYLHAK